MSLDGLSQWSSRRRRGLGLAGMLAAFTGVSMILNPTHAIGLVWLGLPLLFGGFGLFAWIAWPRSHNQEMTANPPSSLGTRFLAWITLHHRLDPLFPVAGVVCVVADLAYNLLLSRSPDLLTEDILVILTASALVGYGFVPSRYSRERDFVLLFFVVLDLILVVPLLIARMLTGSAETSVDVYSWTALAPELGGLLSGIGVANSVHMVAGYTAPGLTFTPLQMTSPVTLVITTSCSGIYSFGIFASGYVAFLLTEYSRPSRRLWLFLGLGFAASYLANLLRMVVIVLVGYYTDSQVSDLQNLLIAHSYAGWIIFLGWLSLFWGPLFKIIAPEVGRSGPRGPPHSKIAPRSRVSRCGICGGPLAPSIPAWNCSCGAFYHRDCMGDPALCPKCQQDLGTSSAGRPGGERDSI